MARISRITERTSSRATTDERIKTTTAKKRTTTTVTRIGIKETSIKIIRSTKNTERTIGTSRRSTIRDIITTTITTTTTTSTRFIRTTRKTTTK